MAADTTAALGGLIDQHFKLKAKKTAAQRKVDAVDAEIAALEERVRAIMREAKLDGAKGKAGSAALGMHVYPTLDDYDQFIAHVKKTGHFDLLQRRLAVGAVRERWENDEVVPGVTQYKELKVTFTAGRAKK